MASKEITVISPEGLEIANSYLTFGNIKGVCQHLNVSEDKVAEQLNKREVQKYIDTVYLDTGYRNRNNIASVLDEMIESKLEEARESEYYTKKDLAELLALAHKIRMEELKAQRESGNIRNQTNVQINDGAGTFGLQGNYGKLMDKLVNGSQ